MGIPNASTAATSATSRHATIRMPPMGNEQFMAELAYQASLSIAEGLLRSGCLTHEDFMTIRTLLLEKYNPPISVLFASIP
jgi:hypothetical protein